MITERVQRMETATSTTVVRLGCPSGDSRLTGSDLIVLASLIREAGDRHVLLLPGGADFCPGRRDDPSEGIGLGVRERVLEPIAAVYEAITSHSGAVIAAVRGRCLGLGFGIACAADLVVAASDAEFALPEAGAGFAPLLALSQVVARLPAPLSRRMALTCETVGVDELLATGFIATVVPPEQLHVTAGALLASMPEGRITQDIKDFFADAHSLPGRDRAAYAVDGLERILSRG